MMRLRQTALVLKLLAQPRRFCYSEPTVTHRDRLCRRGDIVGKLVSKEVIVGNQMRVAGESLTLSSARREYGLVAGDQSAARLARVIIGHVGGNVHTETVARELVVHSSFNTVSLCISYESRIQDSAESMTDD